MTAAFSNGDSLTCHRLTWPCVCGLRVAPASTNYASEHQLRIWRWGSNSLLSCTLRTAVEKGCKTLLFSFAGTWHVLHSGVNEPAGQQQTCPGRSGFRRGPNNTLQSNHKHTLSPTYLICGYSQLRCMQAADSYNLKLQMHKKMHNLEAAFKILRPT